MIKNEEKYLDRCLASLANIRNNIESELVIVDTGSTDSSVEISKKYTEKVYFHEWNNNFSEMRNKVLSYTIGEWVLVIDGDEIVEEDSDFINFINSPSSNTYNAGAVEIRNVLLSEEDHTPSFYAPRVFRNTLDFHFEGAIHNQPNYKKPITIVGIKIVHFGYVSHDKSLMEKKFNRTTKILFAELEKQPENTYYIFQLSVSFGMYGDQEKSLYYARKAYEVAKKNKLNLRKQMYIYTQFIKLLYINGEYDEAILIGEEANKLKPGYLDISYYLGKSFLSIFKEEEALNSFKSYIEIHKNYEKSPGRLDDSVLEYSYGSLSEIKQIVFTLSYKYKDFEYVVSEAFNELDYETVKKTNYHVISSIIELEEWSVLKDYFKLVVGKHKPLEENVINSIERAKNKLLQENRIQIERLFYNDGTYYGLLNKTRLDLNGDLKRTEKKSIIKSIENINFLNLQEYYGDLIYYLLKNNYQKFHTLFINVFESNLSEFLKYIYNKYDDSLNVIYEYLRNNSEVRTFEEIRINKVLARYSLYLFNSDDQLFGYIFKYFIKIGSQWLTYVYSSYVIDNEMIYDLKNEEEQFLLYMYKAENLRKSNVSLSLKYIRKASKIYPPYKQGIKLLLEEISSDVINEDKNQTLNESEDINEFIRKIESYVNKGEFNIAIDLIEKHEKLNGKQHEEIITIKGVIYFYKEEYNAALKCFYHSLTLNSKNSDTLFNLGKLYNHLGRFNQSLLYLDQAYNMTEDVSLKTEISNTINNINENNNIKSIKDEAILETKNKMSYSESLKEEISTKIEKNVNENDYDKMVSLYTPDYLAFNRVVVERGD